VTAGPRPPRIAAIDALRGLVMLLMLVLGMPRRVRQAAMPSGVAPASAVMAASTGARRWR
jgi:uncharacterized membrane protein